MSNNELPFTPGFNAEKSLKSKIDYGYGQISPLYYSANLIILPSRFPCCSECRDPCSDCVSGRGRTGTCSYCAYCNLHCNKSC